MSGGKVVWNRVTGLLSNVVANLTLLGWNPLTFSEWRSPSNEPWIIPLLPDTIFSPHLLIYELQDSAGKQLWKDASTHQHGAGLQDGVAYAYSMQLLFYYRKEKIYDRAAALETVMVGACWPPHRKFLANMITADLDMCSACGASPCDELHQYWTCPKLQESEWPEIVCTQYLIPKACAEIDSLPCVWYRGLLPANFGGLAEIPPPNNSDSFRMYEFDNSPLDLNVQRKDMGF